MDHVTMGFVQAKGRVTLPKKLREAAAIEEGSALVGRVTGHGQILIESADAIRQRVWDAAPEPTGIDATTDVRNMRNEDNDASDARWERSRASVADPEVGRALLSTLGLE